MLSAMQFVIVMYLTINSLLACVDNYCKHVLCFLFNSILERFICLPQELYYEYLAWVIACIVRRVWWQLSHDNFPLESAEVYDCETNQWIYVTSMGSPRGGLCSVMGSDISIIYIFHCLYHIIWLDGQRINLFIT